MNTSNTTQIYEDIAVLKEEREIVQSKLDEISLTNYHLFLDMFNCQQGLKEEVYMILYE